MTTAQVQGSNILDVLKKKMRQTKEEMEKYKEDFDDSQRKLQVEIMRREEVSSRNTTKAEDDLEPEHEVGLQVEGKREKGRGSLLTLSLSLCLQQPPRCSTRLLFLSPLSLSPCSMMAAEPGLLCSD